MNAFLSLISSKLPQLKRLFWVFEDKYLSLHQLFEQTVQVPSLLPKHDYYLLKQCKDFKQEPAGVDEMKLLTTALLSINRSYSSGGGVPLIILHVQQLVCLHKAEDFEFNFHTIQTRT
jgi:hypothetical protein